MYECLFCPYNEMTLGPKAVLTKNDEKILILGWTFSFRSINATTKSLLVQGNSNNSIHFTNWIQKLILEVDQKCLQLHFTDII